MQVTACVRAVTQRLPFGNAAIRAGSPERARSGARIRTIAAVSAPEPPPAAPGSPPSPRQYWQLRHDVDDVYELLGTVERKVDVLTVTQDQHTVQLTEIQQTLRRHDARFAAHDARFDGIDARFDGIDARLAEILELLRRGGSAS